MTTYRSIEGASRRRVFIRVISGGNTDWQLTLIKDLKTSVLACTPSYALNIADRLAGQEQAFDLTRSQLRIGVFGAEPWSEQMRTEIEKRLGVSAYDIYGLSEVIGPGVAADLNRIEWGGRTRGIICDSVAYQYVREVCPEDSVLKIGMVWPLPDALIREFAEAVDQLWVVEELDPFIEDYVKAMGYAVTGKARLPITGELTPDIVDQALNDRPQTEVPVYPDSLPARPPKLCNHCPHSYVFEILRDLDLTVIGDIGCYTLAALDPLNAMHTQTCMGASIGMLLGIEKARGAQATKRTVAVIGDSTFIHSGITGLIDMIYNQGAGTVIVLDNRTTAMTGHQENPASGKPLSGDPAPELDIEQLARAVGVKHTVTLDPKDTAELRRVIERETASQEPSVIIARRKCILKK